MTICHLPKEGVEQLDQRADGVQLKLSFLQDSKVDVSGGQSNLWGSYTLSRNIKPFNHWACIVYKVYQPLVDIGQT